MRILLTGASGFIGRHVLSDLKTKSASTTLMVRSLNSVPSWLVGERLVEIDIHAPADNEFDRLGRPDVLIHLAWGRLSDYRDPYHVDGEFPAQYRFLSGLVRSGLKNLVVAGSCLEYGLQEGCLDADMETDPVTAYGTAKDLLRKKLQELQKDVPFSLSWGRLFYMYGEGQAERSIFSQLKRATEEGNKVFNMSGGEQMRDYLPVSDVAEQIVSLALIPKDRGVLNICSGKPVPIRGLVESWIREYGWSIKPNLGYYPYPDYEPMAFWGKSTKGGHVSFGLRPQFINLGASMKADIKPRINLEGRTPLETVIPLETPFVVFMDPASSCNFRCPFCPTGHLKMIKDTGRYQGAMKYDLFCKAIDDLAEFEKPIKVLRMYKDGEPFLNKRLADMISYAKKSGHVEYIDTTTNGSLLTRERLGAVLEAGLDKINISVDGMNPEQYLEFTKFDFDFDGFVETIKWLYDNKGNCEVVIKIPGELISDKQKQEFLDTFGNYCDRIFIENFAPCWPEFDVEKHTNITITEGIYQQPITPTDTCPYIFYGLSVNADGLVSSCFLDWGRKLIIGDVRSQSIKEIWNSDEMNALRLQHLEGKRSQNQVCSSCGQLSHCLPDNIDKHRNDLLPRFLAHVGHKLKVPAPGS